MKNVHLIATDKLSRLHSYCNNLTYLGLSKEPLHWKEALNIYITDNSEIKEGYYLDLTHNIVMKSVFYSSSDKNCKKIILTTDLDLIADGIQAIDDEFLDWFVKNPSCEFVEVEKETIIEYEPIGHAGGVYEYKIIIPKEEPNIIDQWLEKNDNSEIDKQVEEAAENHWKMQYIMALDESTKPYIIQDFIAGAKWQQEQDKNKYSEEDIINALHSVELKDNKDYSKIYEGMKEWFEKFKKEIR